MKLKTKVVALSLLTLLLPWSAWKLLQELERYLRETQETALLGSARMVAASMPLEFRTALLFAPDRYLMLRPLQRAPSLDGYADEWPGADQTQQFPSAGGYATVRVLAGSHAGRLYLLVDAEAAPDNPEAFSRAVTELRSAGLALLTRDPRGMNRFSIRPGAPGPLQLRSEVGGAGQGEGYWLDTQRGFRVELSLPEGDENSDVSVEITGPDTPLRWLRLLPPWERLSTWLASTVGESSRAWFVDREGWVLADSGFRVEQQYPDAAPPPRTTWLQRLIYRLVADAEMELREEGAGRPVRLTDDAVTRALAGQEAIGWSQ